MRAILGFGLVAFLAAAAFTPASGQTRVKQKTPTRPMSQAMSLVQTIECPELPESGWALELETPDFEHPDHSWVGTVPEGWEFYRLERGGWGRVVYRLSLHAVRESWDREAGTRQYLVCSYGLPPQGGGSTTTMPLFSIQRLGPRTTECEAVSSFRFVCTTECPELPAYGWGLELKTPDFEHPDHSWVGTVPEGWEFYRLERESWGRVTYRRSLHSASQTWTPNGNTVKFVCGYGIPGQPTVSMPLFSIQRPAPTGQACEATDPYRFVCRRR
jgi:hypothetical protein